MTTTRALARVRAQPQTHTQHTNTNTGYYGEEERLDDLAQRREAAEDAEDTEGGARTRTKQVSGREREREGARRCAAP